MCKRLTYNILSAMKTPLFLVISVLFLSNARAQEGRVVIEQDPRISELLEVYKSVNSKTGFYQIQVGSKSNDEAAQRLYDQVRVDFPGWHAEIKFFQPTYRVRVGKFKDALEAERKYLEVRKKYPNAMLLKPEQTGN